MLTSTPTVESAVAIPSTGRRVLQRALSPPSAMITMRAQNPSTRVSSTSWNRMPSPASPIATPSAR